jgi:hypothetical protein
MQNRDQHNPTIVEAEDSEVPVVVTLEDLKVLESVLIAHTTFLAQEAPSWQQGQSHDWQEWKRAQRLLERLTQVLDGPLAADGTFRFALTSQETAHLPVILLAFIRRNFLHSLPVFA